MFTKASNLQRTCGRSAREATLHLQEVQQAVQSAWSIERSWKSLQMITRQIVCVAGEWTLCSHQLDTTRWIKSSGVSRVLTASSYSYATLKGPWNFVDITHLPEPLQVTLLFSNVVSTCTLHFISACKYSSRRYVLSPRCDGTQTIRFLQC